MTCTCQNPLTKFARRGRVSTRTVTGTVGGLWSVAELVDLIAAKDHDTAAFAAELTKSPVSDADWTADYQAFLDRWHSARANAEAKISDAGYMPVPNKDLPAQAEYDAILQAFQVNYPNGPWVKGDWPDLVTRAQAFGVGVDLSGTPQPTAGSDTDLNVYNALPNVPSPSSIPTWEYMLGAAVGVLLIIVVAKVVL